MQGNHTVMIVTVWLYIVPDRVIILNELVKVWLEPEETETVMVKETFPL